MFQITQKKLFLCIVFVSVINYFFITVFYKNIQCKLFKNIHNSFKVNMNISNVTVKLKLSPIYPKCVNCANLKPDDVLNQFGCWIFDSGQTYLTLEKSLCTDSFQENSRSLKRHECPEAIVTVHQLGKLGNQIWEYALLFAVAKEIELDPYVPRCIYDELHQLFELLTIPSLEHIQHCNFDHRTFVNTIDLWKSKSLSLLLPQYSQSPITVIPWLKELREEFQFKKELIHRSNQVLKKANPLLNYTVFVGVHVRRTNYFDHLKGVHNINKIAEPQFYFSAMQYFEQKYPKVIFIVVSDDPDWCSQTFKAKNNVYIASNNLRTPYEDFALLSSCNHSIIDYGSYGIWSAIFAGGDTVFFEIDELESPISKMLPNWYPLSPNCNNTC